MWSSDGRNNLAGVPVAFDVPMRLGDLLKRIGRVDHGCQMAFGESFLDLVDHSRAKPGHPKRALHAGEFDSGKLRWTSTLKPVSGQGEPATA